MAHNLNIINGKTSFASTQKAWHGLGLVVNSAMTSEEAIKLAGLDYTVEKTPVLAEINGVQKIVEDKFTTYRTDTGDAFGVVGGRYEIVQNADAFIFFDAIVGQGQAIFETAGALGSGERIFVSAKMPNYIRINGTDDITEVYVVLTNSHDGSGSVVCGITPIRIVCANTMRMAMKNMVNKVAIRHTKNAEKNLVHAHQLLGITNKYTQQMNEVVNRLALKKMSDSQVKHFIETLFPINSENETRTLNIRGDVLKSYYTGTGQEKILGNAFGLLNGITYYTSHVKSYKDSDTKFENLLLDGGSTKLVNKAVELLVAL